MNEEGFEESSEECLGLNKEAKMGVLGVHMPVRGVVCTRIQNMCGGRV